MSGNDTRQRIMEATYDALCKHGYASLTMQDIANEGQCSKSLLHYHYDTKEDLLVALLEYLIERFDERVDPTDGTPTEQLVDLIDLMCFGGAELEEHQAFNRALLELRVQAPYNAAFRRQLRANDEKIHGTFSTMIARGIDAGEFHAVNADRTASLILSSIQGARTRWIAHADESAIEDVRDSLIEDVVNGWLVK